MHVPETLNDQHTAWLREAFRALSWIGSSPSPHPENIRQEALRLLGKSPFHTGIIETIDNCWMVADETSAILGVWPSHSVASHVQALYAATIDNVSEDEHAEAQRRFHEYTTANPAIRAQ